MRSYSKLLTGDYITVSMVKQYAYCPIIPWINNYLDYHADVTPSMETGREKATPDLKKEVARKLGLPKPYRIEYPVEYTPLKIRGIVDLIAGEKKLSVLEVKVYKRKRKWLNHFKVQLLTYSYIVEKTMGPVYQAILYNGGDVIKIRPTEQDYYKIEKTIRSLLKVLKREDPPVASTNPRKCGYCEYRRLCPLHY